MQLVYIPLSVRLNHEKITMKSYYNSFLPPDPPLVSVEFGLKIEPRRLKEGDDVYLRCKVSANPYPDKIIWFHGVSLENCYTLNFIKQLSWQIHDERILITSIHVF